MQAASAVTTCESRDEERSIDVATQVWNLHGADDDGVRRNGLVFAHAEGVWAEDV